MIKFNMNYEGNEAGQSLPPNIEVTASIDKVRNEKIKEALQGTRLRKVGSWYVRCEIICISL